MSDSACLVIDELPLLRNICGANDYNLRIIERLLGCKIFSKGNELIVEHADETTRTLFFRLIQELSEAIKEGIPPNPELITALHASLLASQKPEHNQEPHGTELFTENAIQVPGAFEKIFPRSVNQAHYIKALSEYDITFATGPAGTGKTFLAVAWALREVLSKTRKKLVLTRPVVEAGESLGFLPGDLTQKISPYLRPLYDAMEAIIPFETIQRLEETHVIEIAPLAYMRGRSLNNCIVILDEAQNTTREQMKMFLTRLGQHAKAIVTGDLTQIDLPKKSDSGLSHALSVISSIPEIYISRFDGRDVVRNPLIKKIIEAYESEPY
ncbi:MAG TPA: PhoH family protein [Spirochaetia bacterium]|nr:PhoH family protein [Spirochaetales bacterium]HRS64530.1 PhoH family protein [Spirochaetia bacterium]HOT59318.1 PhoH family protein [Spirochaetales bacterium]HPD79998.1 PhoH family protein [Spirochaetales bacterium]HQK34882.1 PhoH family protein [Spirochaetales bacterium]